MLYMRVCTYVYVYIINHLFLLLDGIWYLYTSFLRNIIAVLHSKRAIASPIPVLYLFLKLPSSCLASPSIDQ